MPSRVAVIVWRNVIVLCDDGRSVAADYMDLPEIADEVHKRYPQGLGLLAIIPPNAVPPTEPVRKVINETLRDAQHTLRGLSWAIEGNGFQGAMARAVLTGLRFLTTTPYPRNFSTNVFDSVHWLLPRVCGGDSRPADVGEAVAYITSRREALSRFDAGRRGDKTASNAE